MSYKKESHLKPGKLFHFDKILREEAIYKEISKLNKRVYI